MKPDGTDEKVGLELVAVGDILRMKTVDATSPIAYGYSDSVAMYCSNGPIFTLSNLAGRSGGLGRGGGGDVGAAGRGRAGNPPERFKPAGRPVPTSPARIASPFL